MASGFSFNLVGYMPMSIRFSCACFPVARSIYVAASVGAQIFGVRERKQ
jgi:hypothetical protein